MKKLFLLITSVIIFIALLVTYQVSLDTRQVSEVIYRDTTTWKTYTDQHIDFSYPDSWRTEVYGSSTIDWNFQLYNYPEESFGGEMFVYDDTRISMYFATRPETFYPDPHITSRLIKHPKINNLFLIINMYHAEGNHSNDWVLEKMISSVKWP